MQCSKQRSYRESVRTISPDAAVQLHPIEEL